MNLTHDTLKNLARAALRATPGPDFDELPASIGARVLQNMERIRSEFYVVENDIHAAAMRHGWEVAMQHLHAQQIIDDDRLHKALAENPWMKKETTR